MNQPFATDALFRAWLAYRGDTSGWDGSLVAGTDTDIPMPIAVDPPPPLSGLAANPIRGGGAAANPIWGYVA